MSDNKQTMRDLIQKARKIWVQIDQTYLPQMSGKRPTISITCAEALRLIDRCDEQSMPFGRLNAHGQLLLRPAFERTAS